MLVFIIPLLIVVAFSIIFFFGSRRIFHGEIKKSLNYQLFLITVPRDFASAEEKKKEINDLVLPFKQFLDSFGHYDKEVVFEIATPIESEEIRFYVAITREDADLLVKTASAVFPSAKIEATDDYTIFAPAGETIGAVVKLKEHFVLPIKSFQNFKEDPLSAVLNAFSRTGKNEGMALQIIVRANKDKSNNKVMGKIRTDLMEGKNFKEAIADPIFIAKKSITDSWEAQNKEEKIKKEKPKMIDERLIKLIEEKSQNPLFSANIRILVSSASLQKGRTEEIYSHLKEVFNAFYSPGGNDFVVNLLKNKRHLKKLVYDFSFRNFRYEESILLNTAELATVFHFPHPLIDITRVRWLKARSASPPLNLPQQGPVLGISYFEGQEREVRIKDEDRRKHIYSVGQTGTGKTTLLKNVFIQDMEQGKGAVFIDPHGDAAEEILGFIPKNRIDDVIYFNPGDPQYAIGINILDWDNKYTFQKTFVINELLEIMDKLYDLKLTGGPLFEQYFRYSLHLLLDDLQETHVLGDIVRVFNNAEFREQLLARAPDPMVREFWEKQAVKLKGDWELPQMSAYVVSKLTPFLANDLIRPIVNQKKSGLDFRKIMDEGKIVIVNLSKGVLGNINSYLMGMLIIAKLTMAAFSRQDIPEEERRDFYLYIDEFQNVTTETIGTIFSEARKYRLNLFVGHQFLAQLKEQILKSVFGNVGTVVSFRVGSEDAELLAKYFAPVFAASDLLQLDNFNAYIRLMIENQTSRPFNFRTIKPKPFDRQLAETVKNLSNLKYARLREEVEKEIRSQYQKI